MPPTASYRLVASAIRAEASGDESDLAAVEDPHVYEVFLARHAWHRPVAEVEDHGLAVGEQHHCRLNPTIDLQFAHVTGTQPDRGCIHVDVRPLLKNQHTRMSSDPPGYVRLLMSHRHRERWPLRDLSDRPARKDVGKPVAAPVGELGWAFGQEAPHALAGVGAGAARRDRSRID